MKDKYLRETRMVDFSNPAIQKLIQNMEYQRGTSWKAKLRVSIDKAIWSSINYEEFLQKMQLAGYEIRQGKNLSFRAAYSARTAHPFQRNGAPFRFKLSKAQQVD